MKKSTISRPTSDAQPAIRGGVRTFAPDEPAIESDRAGGAVFYDDGLARHIQRSFMARGVNCWVSTRRDGDRWQHTINAECRPHLFARSVGLGYHAYFTALTGWAMNQIEQPLPYVDWMQFQEHFDPTMKWI